MVKETSTEQLSVVSRRIVDHSDIAKIPDASAQYFGPTAKVDVFHTPNWLIEGGLPTEGTLAHVAVSKYADHLPLYRQCQIYGRGGVDLDRSTLASWCGVLLGTFPAQTA